MKGVRLVAWKEEEGRARLDILSALACPVCFQEMDPAGHLAELKADPPEALVIDLSRRPAQGRDLGVAVRVLASTRQVPLVFAGGSEEEVSRVRNVLPDASFSDWEGVVEAVEDVLRNPPESPVVPDSALAGYSGTPLPKKLGIKPSFRVLLAGAPGELEVTLGELPEGVVLARRFSSRVDLILWFVRSRRELERGIDTWVPRVGKPGIWILWPKKSSGIPSDLQQSVVRRVGLDNGLVDYKIAAVDETWSGLKFSLRKR